MFVRFFAFGRQLWGEAADEGIRVLSGDPFDGAMAPTGKTLAWEVAHLRAPARPSKIVCIGSNYRQHCVELGRPVPAVPKLFLKPPSALIGHEAAIQLPPDVGRVDFEGELALVMGRRASRIPPEAVAEHLLGCTILNDVTARDIQRADIQFTRGKGFDTFCPVGPGVVPGLDPRDLAIRTELNGRRVQDARTSDMVFGPYQLVSFISHVMTLEPGDLISTGTPSGVGPLSPGDTVRISIEGIGALENTVEVRP